MALGRDRDFLFHHETSRFIQDAVAAAAIAQIETNGQMLVRKILLCFVVAMLTFFIAGLLYLLWSEHVDNLGAYRIPPETGLLIPSERDS